MGPDGVTRYVVFGRVYREVQIPSIADLDVPPRPEHVIDRLEHTSSLAEEHLDNSNKTSYTFSQNTRTGRSQSECDMEEQ